MPNRRAKKRRLSKEKAKPTGGFDELLPTKDPPHLQRFPHHDGAIEFVSLLSDENPGSHSHVFDVVIEGKHYALKMASSTGGLFCSRLIFLSRQFKFYDVAEHEQELGDRVNRDTIVAHLDPFFAECRAYGRIEEKQRNGKVAVRCYGFLSVSATQESYLRNKFHVTDWDRPEEEYDLPVRERQSFRAIVKDLIEDKTSFRTKHLTRMVMDLRALRKMPLFVRDIREDNYRGGKLLDFSVSWTVPHVMLDMRIRSDIHIAEDILEELILFDEMVTESGVPNPKSIRATAHPDFVRGTVPTENTKELSKLRPQPLRR